MKKKIPFLIVGVVATLVLLIGFWLFGFMELRGTKQRTEILSEKRAILEAQRENLQSLEAFIGNIAADQERIAGVFVSEQTLVRLIERLERLAGEAGISLAIQEARLPKNADERLSIRFSTVGNFRDTMQYLLLIEHAPYQLQFTGVEIQKNDTKEHNDEWNAHYQFNVLSFE